MRQQLFSVLSTSLASLFVFLTPIRELIYATGALLIIDFILGVLSSRKRGIGFNSKDGKKTIVKMFIYEIAILTGFLLDKYFVPGNVIVRVVMMAIGLIESQSIFENIYILTGLDIWGALKAKMADVISASTKKKISEEAAPEDKKDPPAPTA